MSGDFTEVPAVAASRVWRRRSRRLLVRGTGAAPTPGWLAPPIRMVVADRAASGPSGVNSDPVGDLPQWPRFDLYR